MKNISLVLSSLAIIGVIGLFVLRSKGDAKTVGGDNAMTISPAATAGKIAYVDIDSLEANYEYLKTKKEVFKNRQQQAENELERSAQQMQNEANDIQAKMQAGTLTKSEYEAAQKRFEQMQQSLATRKQALTDQLMKEQDDFNKDLKSKLDSFLADYNKDRHYDYILSYGNGGSILYSNKGLDITKDVIKGMNARNPATDNKK